MKNYFNNTDNKTSDINIEVKPKFGMKLAPISSICSILLGGIIALISSFSFLIDIVTTRNLVALSIDIVVMTLSYLTVWQGIYYTILDRITKKNMEDEWDYRMKPVLALLTETTGRISTIESDIIETNMNVKATLDYVMKTQDMDASKMYILPGMSFKFISKILVLIFFTFSSLVYVSSYPLGIVHYFILAIYLAWWTFITVEYKLFENTTAWVWAIAPVMIIPTVGMIMSAIYGLNIMIGIFFLVMLIYVYSYYSWACYIATGYKMFDMKSVAYNISKKLRRDAKSTMKNEDLEGLIK